MIEFAEFAEDGTWPESGGLLDQSRLFTQACRFIWAEQRRNKADLGIMG